MMARKYPVTFLLLLANVLVFAFFAVRQQTLMFTTNEDFFVVFSAGANFNPFVLDGEPWRLFTSMFLHGNILHLAMNMYALYAIGRAIEEEEDSLRLFLIYMIAGVAGGLASIAFNLFARGVGASGAIFGLYGYQIVTALIRHRNNKDALISIVVNFMIFVGINTAIAISVNQGSYGFTIDIAAHFGGLIAGILLALWRSIGYFNSPALAFVLLLTFVSHYFLPKDQLVYYKAYQGVIEAEHYQNELFNSKLNDHQIADSLEASLSQWDSVAGKLDRLPYVHPELRHDTLVLKNYALLRKEMAHFIVLQVQKESYIYLDSQEIVGEKLDSLPHLEHYLSFKPGKAAPAPEEESLQALEPVTVYYDSNWRETTEIHAAYFRTGYRDSLQRWQGKVRDYYRDGKIQMKGTYKDGMNDGVFLYYSHEGKYESAGRYDEENPVGKWEEFHKNGKLQRETDFKDRVFIRNVYDTAGIPQVVNGNGTEISYHSNGIVAEQGEIRDGRKEGIWKGYHPNGKPYFEEYYRDNQLVKGMSIDASGARHIYDQSSFYPYPQAGMDAYEKYLSDNLRADGLPYREGVVKLMFSVDPDGSLHDFLVMKSVCRPCDEEAIRLVKEGPPWRPALIRGHQKTPSKGMIDVSISH
jgi:membrane associated rhomboid family serine protease/antitoxin component YwqK of YwqJK toxin-antitoxin module